FAELSGTERWRDPAFSSLHCWVRDYVGVVTRRGTAWIRLSHGSERDELWGPSTVDAICKSLPAIDAPDDGPVWTLGRPRR
ncbi:MAG: hypothetical protein AAFZ65_20780, partial [Planctomycetota bacterium]